MDLNEKIEIENFFINIIKKYTKLPKIQFNNSDYSPRFFEFINIVDAVDVDFMYKFTIENKYHMIEKIYNAYFFSFSRDDLNIFFQIPLDETKRIISVTFDIKSFRNFIQTFNFDSSYIIDSIKEYYKARENLQSKIDKLDSCIDIPIEFL